MPLDPSWNDLTLRLVLAVFAGGCIGLNRGEHGRPAGLRTTILVCVAAAVSMIQANILLDTAGKSHNSFAVLDLMRLPLGILSGMGFIGAGAILRRGNLVTGVTTAATLWYVTVMGLCFGGGQNILGLAMLGLCLAVLSALKKIETLLKEDHHATLCLMIDGDSLSADDIRAFLSDGGLQVRSCGVRYAAHAKRCSLRFDVTWRDAAEATCIPPVVDQLAARPSIRRLKWQP